MGGRMRGEGGEEGGWEEGREGVGGWEVGGGAEGGRGKRWRWV